MNQTQRKYAANRLQMLATKKKSELKDLYKVPAVSLTKEEKVKLINSGKITAKVPDVSYPRYLSDFFDFSEFENSSYIKDGWQEQDKKIDNALTSALDVVYLGDEEHALSVITNFEKEVN